MGGKPSLLLVDRNPKMSDPNLVTYLEWALIFECCVVRCGSRNRHQKTYVFRVIGLHAQNVSTIQSSFSQHKWGWGTRLYVLLLRERVFDFDNENLIFIWAPNITRKMLMTIIWICQSSHTDHMLHILGEVSARSITTQTPLVHFILTQATPMLPL